VQVELRPITPADLEACIEIFYVADEALTTGLGLSVQPRNPAAMMGIFEHVSTTTPHRAWLAERDGEILGFGMGADREDLAFLSFLFVRPNVQLGGIGRALYERCIPRDGYRATCIWSVQPISAALYARDGLVPRVPFYTFIGRPRSALPGLAAGMALAPIDERQLDLLDREVLGFTRAVDHTAWQRWERMPFALLEGADLAGYGYVQRAGRLGPVVVRRQEHLLPLIGALMEQIEVVEDWMVHVPGVAADAFAGLLAAGMRLDGPPVIFCATQPGIDHTRYLPATFALP
jgi:GNAT superfamily N-acetyltransferase